MIMTLCQVTVLVMKQLRGEVLAILQSALQCCALLITHIKLNLR
jgi:hypothetical protein